ncbi:dynein axonemal assembly factor 6 [Sitodiplosis mosellana]|uniref:dynein axonemal assembly factor 6 n=1 Tax=Sitodiplosis mosellana TaxID=263140 RepID=UPI002444E698|nr:dynein axonemal assembly factor 6 [Sitodiplosis mosellana]
MDYFENSSNLKLIQDLLTEPERNSSDEEPDDRVPSTGIKFSTPSTTSITQGQNDDKSSAEAAASSLLGERQRFRNTALNQTVVEWEEQDAIVNDDELEDRITPEYRIVYKQSVTPEDIYLQMGNKTAATSSCEELCLEILMPKEIVSIDRMQLDVTQNEIDLRTPVYRLKLPLVQPTDPDRGKAHWDDKKKILRLTLRMKREYDFINF